MSQRSMALAPLEVLLAATAQAHARRGKQRRLKYIGMQLSHVDGSKVAFLAFLHECGLSANECGKNTRHVSLSAMETPGLIQVISNL